MRWWAQAAVQAHECPALVVGASQHRVDFGRVGGGDHVDGLVQVSVGSRDRHSRVAGLDPKVGGLLEPPQRHDRLDVRGRRALPRTPVGGPCGVQPTSGSPAPQCRVAPHSLRDEIASNRLRILDGFRESRPQSGTATEHSTKTHTCDQAGIRAARPIARSSPRISARARTRWSVAAMNRSCSTERSTRSRSDEG